MFQDAALLRGIEPKSIDLVVTSPPYPMIEMWDNLFAMQCPRVDTALEKRRGNEAFEQMHRVLDNVWKALYPVLKPGAICCINIGDAVRTIDNVFALYANHTRIARSMATNGFTSLPCILWRKQTNAPNKFMGSGMLPAGAHVTLEHEYILIFRKGGKREFTTTAEKQLRRESAFFWEERNTWFSDVWMDIKGASQSLVSKTARRRSAAYPFELAYRLINMFSVKGDTVLDPFMGTGTTLLAAMASCRNSLGVDIAREFGNDTASAVRGIVKAANDRIRRRIENHLAFIETRKEQKKEIKHLNRPYGFPVVTSQEKDLFFNTLTQAKAVGSDRFEVKYSEEPDRTIRAYYGDLFLHAKN